MPDMKTAAKSAKPKSFRARPKNVSEKDYDTIIGRSHLKGYDNWPPPKHVYEHLEVFVDFIENNVAPGSVLDLGCGDGSIDIILATNNPKREIVGFDLEAHEQWSLKGPKNLSYKTGSIFDMPFKPKSFDVVIIKDVLHHLPNPEKIIPAIIGLARKQVLVIEANRYNPVSYVRMVKIAKHEHLSKRSLKKVIGKPGQLYTTETHVWPGKTKLLGKLHDAAFTHVPLLKQLRNYNFVLIDASGKKPK